VRRRVSPFESTIPPSRFLMGVDPELLSNQYKPPSGIV
jgi:hypothetical protein